MFGFFNICTVRYGWFRPSRLALPGDYLRAYATRFAVNCWTGIRGIYFPARTHSYCGFRSPTAHFVDCTCARARVTCPRRPAAALDCVVPGGLSFAVADWTWMDTGQGLLHSLPLPQAVAGCLHGCRIYASVVLPVVVLAYDYPLQPHSGFLDSGTPRWTRTPSMTTTTRVGSSQFLV